jgi:tRNA-specific adenosine deaminase 3
VKEVIYLYPMSKTGGCGGSACLPTLKGVNHRFTIFQWKAKLRLAEEDIKIDPTIDV